MKSGFQAIIIGVCIFFVFIALLIFTGVIPGMGGKKAEEITGTVTLWGTLPASQINELLNRFNTDMKTFSVRYVEKKQDVFEEELVSAIASNRGPDMILFTPDLVVAQKDKIYPFAYESLTERQFRDTFIDEGNLFLSPQGVLALPVVVDPMMMYINRDILADAGLPSAPQYWDEFQGLVKDVTQKDENGTIKRSLISFGEFDNVTHAKEILSMLILQLGNPIIEPVYGQEEGKVTVGYKTVMANEGADGVRPAEAALRFYSQFGDPVKPTYSWNKTMPNSRNAFIGGSLAIYFGFASEYSSIQAKNPLLSFDISRVPQVRNYPTKGTYGKITGIAVLKTSQNLKAAFYATSQLSNSTYANMFSIVTGLPPTRRDLLAERKTDAVQGAVWPSAIIAKGFIDPNAKATNDIYRAMVNNYISGRSSITEAIQTAVNRIQDTIE